MNWGFFMEMLIDVTNKDRVWISKSYLLKGKKEVYVIGRGPNSDVRLPPAEMLSRDHAFIIKKGREFYVGDMSSKGTGLKLSDGTGSYFRTDLLDNVLECEPFVGNFEKDGGLKADKSAFEMEIHSGKFDEISIKRNYLLGEFLFDRKGKMNEENVDMMKDMQVIRLMESGDIIQIYPAVELEFRSGLLSGLRGKIGI
jgi:hypothetical protein